MAYGPLRERVLCHPADTIRRGNRLKIRYIIMVIIIIIVIIIVTNIIIIVTSITNNKIVIITTIKVISSKE
jgi:hypothetical protein